MRTFLIAPLLALGVAAAAAPAAAQTMPGELPCGARDELTARLSRMFGEVRMGTGLISEDRLLELWSSAETGSWTILMTRADGVSCIVAAGDFWREVPIEFQGRPREPA